MGASQGAVARAAVERQLRGTGRDIRGMIVSALLFTTLVVSLAILVVLVTDVARRGIPVLAERGGEFLRAGYSTIPSRAGVGQALVGSGILMGFVILVAFPLGIGAAVYLEEYARDSAFTRIVTATVRNLAGVPAIVYGLLGLQIFVTSLRGLTGGPNVISGGLTLAVLILPLVIITTSEALRAVPNAIREAGFGVGATRWEVVRSHVLPAAAPGVMTGVILSLARAFGETAPLILVGAKLGFFTAGSGGLADVLRGPYTALPTIVFLFSRQPRAEFRDLAAAAIVVLLGVLLVMNSLAISLRNRYERAR